MPTQQPSTPAARTQRHSQRGRHAGPDVCQICGNSYTAHDVLPGALVRDNIVELIRARLPSWDHSGFICRACLNRFRGEYVRAQMEQDRGALSALEEEV